MGYRSDVKAVFYANAPEPKLADAVAAVKAWFTVRKSEYLANEDTRKDAEWLFSDMEDNASEFGWEERETGYVFTALGMKWYDDFSEVKLFDRMSKDFCETFIDGIDGNEGRFYAYEFVRVGEDIEDNVHEMYGNTRCELSIHREITCEL
jgi:hypothetical protein